MNRYAHDEATVQRLIADIDACTPRPHQSSLLEVMASVMPEYPFRFALTRGGWYRPGGLIQADGARRAGNLDDWLMQELADCKDDLAEFMDRHDGGSLWVTRHTGRTHYFVAQYGAEPTEFLQLEVEELQEVVDRKLWDPATPPEDAQELSDPVNPATLPAHVVGAQYYRFLRLIDIKQVVARLQAPVGEMHSLARFLQEWRADHGDAGKLFCDHWILALREHHDRFNNVQISAIPVSRHARALKSFHWNDALRGLDAGRQLQAFDRAAGYSGAWYFHLVTSGLTPHSIASAVRQDIESGYGYLGDLETALLHGWLHKPYSI